MAATATSHAPTKPVTDELTVEKVREYLADLPDNDTRVATINVESDAVITTRANEAPFKVTKIIFQVEQEGFAYVSSFGGAWYVRAATSDECRLLA